ncbi:MAG: hypothetical protein IKW04_06305 [Clostridia bacterium]|nr:hypothetical protein [Clostridia bacterium]
MNKTLRILLLAVGGVLIGAFANQLGTANGVAMFTLGILLAVSSMITVTQKEKQPTKMNPHKKKK